MEANIVDRRPVASPRARTSSRALRLLAALALTAAAVLLPAGAATAAGEPGLERPAPGERVTHDGPYQVSAFVDAGPGEEIRGMETRLLSGGTQAGPVKTMDFVGSTDTGPGMRRTRWALALDPLKSWDGGEPLLNGAYRVEVRASIVFQGVPREPTAWRGVDFVIDVDPPGTSVSASVLDAEQRRVEVAWEPVLVPDFTRYVVQRKTGSGQWSDYREIPAVDKTRWADTVLTDGDYAYRVQTYRRAAGGGERKSEWSAPSAVRVEKPPPPPPPAQDTGEGANGGGQAGPPVLSVRRPPPARPPAFTGPDTFEETLDYGDAEVPLASGPEEPQDEPDDPAGSLSVREDSGFPVRQALVPVAAGLVLTVSAWHVRRFLRVPS